MGQFHLVESGTKSKYVVHPTNEAIKKNYTKISRIVKSYLINFNVLCKWWALRLRSHQSCAKSTWIHLCILRGWERSFRGPPRRECACLSQGNYEREGLGAGAFEEVGISKSSRKYSRDEVRFNICQIVERSHWLSKNCWLLCPLPYLHMCMREGSVAPKWHLVGTGGGECRWAERAEAISIILWRQAEEAGERWVKKLHHYQSEGFD